VRLTTEGRRKRQENGIGEISGKVDSRRSREFAERQTARAAARVARDARAAALKSRPRGTKARSGSSSTIEAEAAAHEAVIREQAARELDLKAEQKAGRDARYAARKARQR
jgi:hypothetical protein